jgi:plasmid stabilization system protein ParE
MRIRWTTAAAGDLEQISDYLKDRHSRYRLPTMRKLYQAIGTLKSGHKAAE